jgi:hypothetical protein
MRWRGQLLNFAERRVGGAGPLPTIAGLFLHVLPRQSTVRKDGVMDWSSAAFENNREALKCAFASIARIPPHSPTI